MDLSKAQLLAKTSHAAAKVMVKPFATLFDHFENPHDIPATILLVADARATADGRTLPVPEQMRAVEAADLTMLQVVLLLLVTAGAATFEFPLGMSLKSFKSGRPPHFPLPYVRLKSPEEVELAARRVGLKLTPYMERLLNYGHWRQIWGV